MTKPRIKAAPPPADLDEENEVSDFLDYEALTPRLTEIRQKLGLSDDADIEAKAHVWKLNADGEGTDYKVFEGLPEQYDLRKLAQQFGSGRYKLAVYARNETGNMPPLLPGRSGVLAGAHPNAVILDPEFDVVDDTAITASEAIDAK